jgi:hypothetical protein
MAVNHSAGISCRVAANNDGTFFWIQWTLNSCRLSCSLQNNYILEI